MKEFLSNLFSTFVGALLAVVVLIFTPQIVDRFEYLNPSCDNPEGLSSLRLNEMYKGNQLSIKATSIAQPLPATPRTCGKQLMSLMATLVHLGCRPRKTTSVD